jgi:hypothetical protein
MSFWLWCALAWYLIGWVIYAWHLYDEGHVRVSDLVWGAFVALWEIPAVVMFAFGWLAHYVAHAGDKVLWQRKDRQ